jgi:hypothetical protein
MSAELSLDARELSRNRVRRLGQLEREKLIGDISENLGSLIAGESTRCGIAGFERTRPGLL